MKKKKNSLEADLHRYVTFIYATNNNPVWVSFRILLLRYHWLLNNKNNDDDDTGKMIKWKRHRGNKSVVIEARVLTLSPNEYCTTIGVYFLESDVWNFLFIYRYRIFFIRRGVGIFGFNITFEWLWFGRYGDWCLMVFISKGTSYNPIKIKNC